MSRPNKRKQQKQKKREREKRNRQVKAEEAARVRRKADRYPRLVLNEEEAPPGLLSLVNEALNEIDLADPKQFSRAVRLYFRLQRERGSLAALKKIKESWEGSDSEWQVFQVQVSCAIGQRLFKLLEDRGLHSYIPFTDIQVLPIGPRMVVTFRSLCERKSDHGKIYYSRHEPTLVVGGVERRIGWMRHAIQRACERIVPSWRTYGGLGDAYAFFDQCLYFEPCVLPDGGPAFTFYESCPPGFYRYRYVTDVLGLKTPDPNKQFYFRVGYCPVVENEGFYVAKTILFPGFKNTPEWELLRQAPLPRDQRRAMMERAKEQEFSTLLEDEDFSLIRWFHENGVEQVREFSKTIYAPPAVPGVTWTQSSNSEKLDRDQPR